MTDAPKHEATKVTIAASAELARVLRLISVRFTAVSGRLTSARPFTPGDSLHFDMPVLDVAWRLEGNVLDVLLPFVIRVKPAQEATEVLFEIDVAIMVQYQNQGSDPLDLEKCRNFAGISGFLHAWPYLRAETQALSVKLGFPPLTLPPVVVDQVPPRVRVGPQIELDALEPTTKPTARKRVKT